MNGRLKWLDTARGIGILLVVLGHSVTTSIRMDSNVALNLYNAIYLFHMPLLFFISGYAFSISYDRYLEVDAGDYLLKKVKKLLVPYISYSFLIYILVSVAHAFPSFSQKMIAAGFEPLSIKNWAIDLLTGQNQYCQHLWYIYSLFLLSVLSFILVKVFKTKYKYAMLIIAIALYPLWMKLSKTDLDVLWKTFYRGLWFAIGLNIRISSDNKNRNILINFIGVALAIPIMIYVQRNIHVVFIKQTITIITIFLIVILCISVAKSKFVEKFTFLSWLGKNSFSIYLFHQPLFGSGLGVILYKFLGVPLILSVALSFVLCIVVPLLIVRILSIKRLTFLKKLFLG